MTYFRFILAMAVAAFGGIANAQAEGKSVIFLSVSDLCSYCAAVNITAEKKAAEMGIDLEVVRNNFSATDQAAEVDQALAKNPDGIIIWPVDANALIPSFRKIQRAGIPLLVTTSTVDDKHSDLWFSWHGPDDISMSAKAARDMVEAMKSKGLGDTGEIVMVTGFSGNPATIGRRKGFTDELAKIAPGIKIVGEQPGNWEPGESQKAMAGLLTQFPNIKGVFAQDDAMAAGVVAALEQAGRDPSKLAITSLVCYPVGRELIKSGKIYSTVTQSPMEDAINSITDMANHLEGKPVEAKYYLESTPVTKDNVDEVCPKWPVE